MLPFKVNRFLWVCDTQSGCMLPLYPLSIPNSTACEDQAPYSTETLHTDESVLSSQLVAVHHKSHRVERCHHRQSTLYAQQIGSLHAVLWITVLASPECAIRLVCAVQLLCMEWWFGRYTSCHVDTQTIRHMPCIISRSLWVGVNSLHGRRHGGEGELLATCRA